MHAVKQVIVIAALSAIVALVVVAPTGALFIFHPAISAAVWGPHPGYVAGPAYGAAAYRPYGYVPYGTGAGAAYATGAAAGAAATASALDVGPAGGHPDDHHGRRASNRILCARTSVDVHEYQCQCGDVFSVRRCLLSTHVSREVADVRGREEPGLRGAQASCQDARPGMSGTSCAPHLPANTAVTIYDGHVRWTFGPDTRALMSSGRLNVAVESWSQR